MVSANTPGSNSSFLTLTIRSYLQWSWYKLPSRRSSLVGLRFGWCRDHFQRREGSDAWRRGKPYPTGIMLEWRREEKNTPLGKPPCKLANRDFQTGSFRVRDFVHTSHHCDCSTYPKYCCKVGT